VNRHASSLSVGVRPIRELFREEIVGANRYWFCKLCPYAWYEESVVDGWPLSIDGLFHLVKHLRGHTSS
jgi:hypothetical protein